MNGATEFSDWINAFLEGVFKLDEIPSLRIRKRKDSNSKIIPPKVMFAAKSVLQRRQNTTVNFPSRFACKVDRFAFICNIHAGSFNFGTQYFK